jgi:hypothetical protein
MVPSPFPRLATLTLPLDEFAGTYLECFGKLAECPGMSLGGSVFEPPDRLVGKPGYARKLSLGEDSFLPQHLQLCHVDLHSLNDTTSASFITNIISISYHKVGKKAVRKVPADSGATIKQ